MAEGKALVGFRVSESFRKRLDAERRKRRMSTQDMIQAALELYFKTPVEDWDYAEFVTTGEGRLSKRELDEIEAWHNTWSSYIKQMPREKVLLMAQGMILDLRHYSSSRRKGGVKKTAE